jgi:hypothetical protein
MRKVIFLFFLLLVGTLRAQSLSNSVIGSSGADFSSGNNQLSWTIGEPVVSTLSAANNQLTQGFHQPYITVSSIEINESFSVKVFPNPTHEAISVVFENPANCQLEIFDMLGRKLQVFSLKNADNSIISLSDYPSGNYLLRITEANSYQTFKIQKIR